MMNLVSHDENEDSLSDSPRPAVTRNVLNQARAVSVPAKELLALHSQFGGIEGGRFPITFRAEGLFPDTPLPREMFQTFTSTYKDVDGSISRYLKEHLEKQMMAAENKSSSARRHERKTREEEMVAARSLMWKKQTENAQIERDALQAQLDAIKQNNPCLVPEKSSRKRKPTGDVVEEESSVPTSTTSSSSSSG